jgi:hypothetical protein
MGAMAAGRWHSAHLLKMSGATSFENVGADGGVALAAVGGEDADRPIVEISAAPNENHQP